MEKLFEFLAQFGSLFQFWAVLEEYEEGVIFTLGRPRRKVHVIGPGFHLVLPFGLESVVAYNTGLNCSTLKPQVMTSKEGAKISVAPVIIWRIHNVYKLAVEVEDDEETVYAHIRSILSEFVRTTTWEDMQKPEWYEGLAKEARKVGFKYGVEIVELGLADFVRLDFAGLLAGGLHAA